MQVDVRVIAAPTAISKKPSAKASSARIFITASPLLQSSSALRDQRRHYALGRVLIDRYNPIQEVDSWHHDDTRRLILAIIAGNVRELKTPSNAE